MYQSAVWDEPLLNELQDSTQEKHLIKPLLPDTIQRKKPIDIPTMDETVVMRHFMHLSQMNYGIESGIYPL
jgi:glycine dehydrogenase subunit 2